MQCPHCQSEISVTPHVFALGEDRDGSWQVSTTRCPACERLIVSLCSKDGCTYPIRPASSTRPRLGDDVPGEFADDYHVACEIMTYSPEASAAISRRLLQRFLAAHTGAGEGTLGEQINTVAASTELPPYLKEALRTLSWVAKLDPQSEKSLRPGTLASVEPGEAEWLLDVLQPLFEFQFVQPARLLRSQSALEEKIGPLAPASTEAAFAAPATSAAPAEEPPVEAVAGAPPQAAAEAPVEAAPVAPRTRMPLPPSAL
jgi:hypothetical protein